MKNYSFLIALCAGLMSCEKVIEVDLNEGSPQLVIEAPLYEGAHFFEVKISKTASYFDNETIPFVNDAEVFLEGTDGTSTALDFVGDGKYGAEVDTKNQSFYTLRVNHEMGEYLASSYLHQPVGIEELTYEVSSVSGPPIGPESDTAIGDDYVVTVHFADVPDQDNYYRFNAFANGSPLLSPFGGGYYLSNDFERDGNNFEYQLIRANVKAGDNVMVELWTIDQSTYDYFDTFEASGGPGPQQSASPANPISNWTNGGLGYFAAIAKTRMAVEIKP